MTSFRLFLGLLTATALSVAACNAETVTTDPDPVEPAAPAAGEVVVERIDSEAESFRLVRVADGLENPWAVGFLPDGRLIVTERPGRMSVVANGQVTELAGVPEVAAMGQGGLLDVVPHPDFDDNGWIYFTFSDPGDDGAGTALARGRLADDALTDVDILYSMEPKTGARAHFGSRILFLGDGTMLFTIGDRGDMDRAQDTMDPAGGTIRLNEDGTIPDDNPFVNQDGHLPEFYTVGNRNSQGMARHPDTGDVWQTEHGPRGGDELNLIRPGVNYGWPEATWGVDYRTRDQIGVPHDQAPQFEAPVEHWTPAIAPSGLAFYTGEAFPAWSGNLFIGSLVQQKLIRVELDGQRVTHQEDLIEGEIGRIRDVRSGPDGFIYLVTDDGDGGVYRLEPIE